MNFCSVCGKGPVPLKIPEQDNLPRYVCTHCKTVHYINPKLVVGCLPIFKNKVLLAKRAIEPRKNLWNVPCGFMECDETVQEGAVREVWEETGARVTIRSLHCVYDIPHAQQVYLIFLADMASQDFLKQTSESTEVALFEEHEIPWADMAFTSSTFAIQKFFEDLKSDAHQVHFGQFDKRK